MNYSFCPWAEPLSEVTRDEPRAMTGFLKDIASVTPARLPPFDFADREEGPPRLLVSFDWEPGSRAWRLGIVEPKAVGLLE